MEYEEESLMSTHASTEHTSAVRNLQIATMIWMSIELVVAVSAGVHVRSVALIAFGGDSAVELLSATVALQRFRLGPSAEHRAARINAILLYVLAAYVLLTSVLSLMNDRFRPRPSILGILLLALAATIMPALARAKKRFAIKTCSGALKADAVLSDICAYMSWIALAGLIINAAFHVPWADSAAALLLLPLIFGRPMKPVRAKSAADATPADIIGVPSRHRGKIGVIPLVYGVFRDLLV
jgi:divalent metal cation (Fe/Co/Zn/Cd) transporter